MILPTAVFLFAIATTAFWSYRLPSTLSFSLHRHVQDRSRSRRSVIVEPRPILFSHTMESTEERRRYPWSSSVTDDVDARPPYLNRSYYLYQPSSSTNSTANLAPLWEKWCCPPLTNEGSVVNPLSFFFAMPSSRRKEAPSLNNVDITVLWNPETDDPKDVAINVVRQCLVAKGRNDDNEDVDVDDVALSPLVSSLVESLQAYRDFCQMYLRLDIDDDSRLDNCSCCTLNHPDKDHGSIDSRLFKCRLVATRGPSGAKCPQFHLDHVPVRWIQSLAGPGVVLVEMMRPVSVDKVEQEHDNDGDGIAWNAFGKDDDDNEGVEDRNDLSALSVQDRNRRLVDPKRAEIYRVKEGEAVVMIGSRWNEFAQIPKNVLKPVIHKSPEVMKDVGRVLFTQDVVD